MIKSIELLRYKVGNNENEIPLIVLQNYNTNSQIKARYMHITLSLKIVQYKYYKDKKHIEKTSDKEVVARDITVLML